MIYYLSVILVSFCSIVLGQQTDLTPDVSTKGFNDTNANLSHDNRTWIEKNQKYIIIAVVVVVVLALLTWYIVRSIRGMRKRLAKENQGHMMAIQGSGSGISETVPIDGHGFQKMTDYSVAPQQPYTHRY